MKLSGGLIFSKNEIRKKEEKKIGIFMKKLNKKKTSETSSKKMTGKGGNAKMAD